MSQVTIREIPPALGRPVADVAVWPTSGVRSLVDRLGICEVRRRLLHMAPGLLPILLAIIPHADPWGWPLISIVIGLFLMVTTFAIVRADDFARPQETGWAVSVMGYSLPVLGMLLLFPGRAELGLLTLGIMAFGDGSAALGGKLFGRRPLNWNPGKTWVGLLCFVLAGTTVATLNYWLEARPGVSLLIALAIALPATLVGAVVESLPIRTHDNFRVGISAGLTAILMHVLILGW